MKHIRKKKNIIIIVAIIILIMTADIVKVYATSTNELRQQQQRNQQSIKETEEEQEKVKSQMSSIQKEVEELNSQISDYEVEILNLSNSIEETSKKIEIMQIDLNGKQKELEEKEELLEKRLVASYKAGNTSYLDVLLNSESLTDFLSNYYLMEQLAESDTKLINSIKEAKKTIEESKVALEESKKDLEITKKTIESKKELLAVSKSEKSVKVSQLSEEVQELEEKIEEMRAEDANILAAIKASEKNNNKPSNNTGGSSQTPSLSGFILPIPRAYSLVTTGWYYSATGQFKGGLHGGTDFGAGGIYGQPVYAAKAGTIMTTENRTDGYGTHVTINHHDGTYTLYAHGIRGSICVSPGQYVSQGQQIMQVGSTGKSTGAHLHFEIRIGSGTWNERVNPLEYLPL